MLLTKKTVNQTKEKVEKYYVLSISMVKKKFNDFRCCHTSKNVAEHSGRPIEICTLEKLKKSMVLSDRRLKVREIVDVIGLHIVVWFSFEMINWV